MFPNKNALARFHAKFEGAQHAGMNPLALPCQNLLTASPIFFFELQAVLQADDVGLEKGHEPHLSVDPCRESQLGACKVFLLPRCHSKEPVLSADDRLLVNRQLARPLAIQVWIIPAKIRRSHGGQLPYLELPPPPQNPETTAKTTPKP